MAAQFAIIPDYLIEASPAALRVYFYLALRADHKTGQCWPSRATIGNALNVSPQTVDRAIKTLAGMGALIVEHRLDSAGDWTSNLYTLPFAISRRGVAPPVVPPSPTPGATGSPTSDQGVAPPVSNDPDSYSEPIDPEALNALPREEGEPWKHYLIRIAALGE